EAVVAPRHARVAVLVVQAQAEDADDPGLFCVAGHEGAPKEWASVAFVVYRLYVRPADRVNRFRHAFPPRPATPALEARMVLSQPLRILLVEDNPVNQKLALAHLVRGGHAVTIAGNGKEALSCLAGAEFDLVLMDIQMPEMDGLEATARIREAERGTDRRLPILALTANAPPGDRERCREAGMARYMTKPFQGGALLQAIEEMLSA